VCRKSVADVKSEPNKEGVHGYSLQEAEAAVKSEDINEEDCGSQSDCRSKTDDETNFKRQTYAKPHTCNVCFRSFCCPSELKRHASVHTGEKLFACSVCAKRFSESRAWQEHIEVVHTQKRPHTCNLCSKRFSLAQNLKSHIKVIHTDEKPYVCPLCGTRFSDSRCLQVHYNVCIHLGERPFSNIDAVKIVN
jgi:KRAB domain-containing zinc finger protein